MAAPACSAGIIAYLNQDMTDDQDINQAHKEEMQRVQARQQEKIRASKKADRGLVLVHTGNGKGKSSAAYGVLVRALGWGHKVGVVQYVKGAWKTGEKNYFRNLPEVDWHTMGEGFTWNTQDRDGDIAAAEKTWAFVAPMLKDSSYNLVVIDELTYMIAYKYLDEDMIIDALVNRPDNQSVVVTGRGGGSRLQEVADTVSEVKEIKHAFKKGIMARKGVDY